MHSIVQKNTKVQPLPNALEIAQSYIARGWTPVPNPFRTKIPSGNNWQLRRIDSTTVAQVFDGSEQNVGVMLGPQSNGLTDVDSDCREAVAIAPYLLPSTNAIFGRASSRASHWLYVTDLAAKIDQATIAFDDPHAKRLSRKARLVELRIGGGDKGAQTVFPGSVHESGEPIAWEENGDPATVDGDDLLRRVQLVAVASLIARNWPAEGGRHDAALTVGGFLTQAGLSETYVAIIAEAVAKAAGDEEWRDRVRAAKDQVSHHLQGGAVRGLPMLAELVGEAAATQIADWIGYIPAVERLQIFQTTADAPSIVPMPAVSARKPQGVQSEPNHTWEDPDLSLLDDRRGDLPEFPINTLANPDLRDWVARAAHGAGTSIGHVAVPLIGMAASIIGTAIRVKVSNSWSQPMTLWVALVGPSGSGKTPGIDATKRALTLLEQIRKPRDDDRKRAHETKAESAKVAHAVWKKEVEEAIKGGFSPPPRPLAADDPGPFVAARLYISDSTIERLAILLNKARPQGILYLADELAGLFLNMSRYTRGGQDNEFWLEAWNGNPYSQERMGRDPVSVKYLLVGIVGGLQPDKLVKSFGDDHDGMYARLLFAWPDEPPYRKLTDDVGEVEPEILNAIKRLDDLGGVDPDKFAPRSIPISPQAREVIEGLRRQVFDEKSVLDGRERDWFSKIPAHAVRLTGSLAMLDWAMSGNAELPKTIDTQFAEAAVTLVRDYFWPHARSAIRLIGVDDNHATARRLLRWLQKRGSTEPISREEVRRVALTQTLDADQTQALLDRLERAGWLRKQVAKHGPAGGRPVTRWEINTQLIVAVRP